jgi:protein-disulfide isomerase
MASKKRHNVAAANPVSSLSLTGATLAAIAAALLALFQWMELVITLQGGESFCAISETLNCDAAWNSPFAKAVHAASFVPVAGWGLIWACVAIGVSLWLWLATLRGAGLENAARAARLTGLIGIGASLVLLFVSFRLGVFCPTCLVTYLTVIAFTGFAFTAAPLSRPLLASLLPALKLPALVAVASYALLIIPGQRTPREAPMHIGQSRAAIHAEQPDRPAAAASDARPQSELARYLASLPASALSAISGSLETMRRSPVVDPERYPPRHRFGPQQAAVKIVDFSDLKCSHCKRLDEVMQEIKKAVPAGSFSAESRFYPLDPSCNPQMPGEAGDRNSVRCVSAKALICLEQDAGMPKLRSQMFAEQASLDTARVYELARELVGKGQAELERCVNSPETDAKLKEDIAYASNFPISGTPIVLINGRLASGLSPFLYAIILAQGNMDDPAFADLPAPRADFHGHDH